MLVVLGVLAGLIPQVPNIDLPPDLVLVLFLPPLVYNAAFLSAPRESRENAIPITGLAVGATAATIAAVAAVTRLVLPGLGWAPALAFAAAIAPTDAVAATSVLTRLGAPSRVVTILEGESLINDGVALTPSTPRACAGRWCRPSGTSSPSCTAAVRSGTRPGGPSHGLSIWKNHGRSADRGWGRTWRAARMRVRATGRPGPICR